MATQLYLKNIYILENTYIDLHFIYFSLIFFHNFSFNMLTIACPFAEELHFHKLSLLAVC